MDNIHELYPRANPVSHILRIGHTGYRRIENNFIAKHIPIQHAVIDASHAQSQKDLVHCLADGGVEIILETKSAELSSVAGISSSARNLPWANHQRVQTPFHYQGSIGRDLAEKIVEFAQTRRKSENVPSRSGG
ncbi:MAG: hypothetical protein WBM41_02185 [Arenicellales bacterium]